MFRNRYWREYPLFLQFILLLLMMFSFISLFTAFAYLIVPKITGASIDDVRAFSEDSPRNVINGALWLQAIVATGFFLVPALLFSYFTHPSPAQYLGLRKPGKPVQWVLAVMIILGAIPVLLWFENIFRGINLGAKAAELQRQNDGMMKAMLNMNNPADLLAAFFVMAMLPAFSEELIFRGVIMRLLHKRTQRTSAAIIITAAIFALVHYNPAGLLAIFFAALLLGLIYYLTGSIWLSIIAHMINNAANIILIYLGKTNSTVKAFVDSDSIPWYFPVCGLVLFAASFYVLWKNRTPLKANWSDDFAGEGANQDV